MPSPKATEELTKMLEEVKTFHEGLLLPWKRAIEKEIEKRKLWEGRIRRGEAVLESEIVGKYATYRTYHYLPTCERWVQTSPR